jgi:hypothetical protein
LVSVRQSIQPDFWNRTERAIPWSRLFVSNAMQNDFYPGQRWISETEPELGFGFDSACHRAASHR